MHNPEGTDAPNEYVEIKGTPGAVIPAGTYLVFIEGDAGTPNPGDLNSLFNLSGLTLGSNGYLLLLQTGHTYGTTPGINPAATVVVGTGAGFTGLPGFASDAGGDIENESYTALLVNSATAPALTTDIDSDNNGVADGATYASWTVLDAVATLDPLATDLGYAVAKFSDAEWVGRPTGDPSGTAQADWVGAGFPGAQPAPYALFGADPTGYEGELLDHLGGPNFPGPDPVVPDLALPALGAVTMLGMAAAAGMLRRRSSSATA